MSSEGPMSEEAQMRLKKGATKGGLSRSDGTRPDVDDEEVEKKGGMSKEAQERLIEGARKGGRARAEQLGREGYQEMGRKGGLSTMHQSGEEAAREKGIQIDEAKYKTKAPLSDIAKTHDEDGDDQTRDEDQKVQNHKEDGDERTHDEDQKAQTHKKDRKAQANA